jgi:hypothetical protein
MSPDVPRLGLIARIFGVIFSPRKTYAAVAAHPRSLGVILCVVLVTGGIQTWFFSTEKGQETITAPIEARMQQQAANGQNTSPQQREAVLRFIRILLRVVGIMQVIILPALIALVAVILMAVLNAVLGDQRSFRQVFAVNAHSAVISAIGSLFVFPLMYATGEPGSPTRLGVLVPGLPEQSFATNLLNAIDLLYVWWFISLAIGLAVLYKRRTGPFAVSLLGLYGAIALIIASFRSFMS